MSSAMYQQQYTTFEMDMFRNVSTLVSRKDALADMNNESVVQLLGLDGKVEQNRLLDDIVAHLGLDSFNKPTKVVPAAAAYEFDTTSVQGQQQHPVDYASENYQTPVYSYVDYSTTETQNNPNNEPENPVSLQEQSTFIPPYLLTPPPSPQEVSTTYPQAPPPVVGNYDTQNPAVAGKTPRGRRKELKTKLYERNQPLSNPEEEKKRLNAINAKKNRDKQKNRMEELENLVASLTSEKETLQTTNSKLKRKCDAFETQLMSISQQLKVPVVILPQE